MARLRIAGIVADVQPDDPGAAAAVATAFREFLTPAPPTFALRVHGRPASAPARGEAAADFLSRDGLLLMRGPAGRARFDYRRRRGVLRDAPDLGVLPGLLTAIALRYLVARGGLVLHAAGVRTAGGALVFFGPSGSGKSTVARRLEADEGAEVLSDEAVAVRPGAGGRWIAEGLPWRGRALAVPLRALFALERGEQLALEPLDAAAFVRRVASSIYVEAPGAWQGGRLLEIAERLGRSVPAFGLRCPLTGPVLPALRARLGEPGTGRR